MGETRRIVSTILIVSGLFSTVTACPSRTPEPARTVSAKRRPCGNDGKCETKGSKTIENTCWQLQWATEHGPEFECVTEEVWDHTKIGDKG
jgi:hypothetical protein